MALWYAFVCGSNYNFTMNTWLSPAPLRNSDEQQHQYVKCEYDYVLHVVKQGSSIVLDHVVPTHESCLMESAGVNDSAEL